MNIINGINVKREMTIVSYGGQISLICFRRVYVEIFVKSKKLIRFLELIPKIL